MKHLLTLLLLYAFATNTLPAQPSEGANVWLVAVGIGAYQHDDIMTRLDFTIQGAYELTRIFEGRQLVGVKPPVLTNQQARRINILRTLEDTFVNNPEVKADDMILFYFSGHGEIAGGKTGICPYDYDGDVRGLITDQELQGIMQRSRAGYKVCFIESCKTKAQSAGITDPSILRQFNSQRRNISGGLVYMTSTRAGEKSWGKPGIGGYFSHYLLRGLEGEANRNDDAYITIDELFTFVSKEVNVYTQGKQSPQINNRGGYDPDMPVMVIPSKLSRSPVADYPPGFEYLAQDLIYIPSSTFQMGDIFSEGDRDEQPVHPVSVPAFYLSRYEVTNGQFCVFLNERGNLNKRGMVWLDLESIHCQIEKHGSTFRPRGGYTDHPVVGVNWYGALAYCQWLSEKTGKKFRLPTEAEWEYAAREQGRIVRFGNGKDIANPEEINFDGSENYRKSYSIVGTFRGGSTPVDALISNSLGLHHMSGNVGEWCQDIYHLDYNGAPGNGSAWTSGGESTRRVVRGGSWDNYPSFCRVADRLVLDASNRYYNVGFRLARY